MSELRTDFKDDVLDVTQNEKRKYRVIHNEDSTISLEDATVYLQQGDSFGANDLNEMNRMANQMNEAAGEILTMADDIDTLQEEMIDITPRVEILESDTQQIKDTLGYTVSKNLLENTGTTTTTNGITFTVNDDGSVTVNGTATANASFYINENIALPNGEYILSGCPEGGTAMTYYLYWSGGMSGTDKGEGYTFFLGDNRSNKVRIHVGSGTTINNLTFYPMIRRADITDDTYEPYVNLSVDFRLETLKSAIQSAIKWKYHGAITTGSTNAETITLPNEFNELYVEVISNQGEYEQSYPISTIIIPKNIIKSTTKYFILPSFSNSSSKYGYCRIQVDLTQLKLTDLYINGNYYQNNGAKVNVYYR